MTQELENKDIETCISLISLLRMISNEIYNVYDILGFLWIDSNISSKAVKELKKTSDNYLENLFYIQTIFEEVEITMNKVAIILKKDIKENLHCNNFNYIETFQTNLENQKFLEQKNIEKNYEIKKILEISMYKVREYFERITKN